MRNFISHQEISVLKVRTKYGNIGSLICWDQWFPEAAITALKGAEIIFYPTAIGWHPIEKKKYGKTQLIHGLLSVKITCNCKWCIFCINRVGIEKKNSRKIEFWGNSVVIDPKWEHYLKTKF